MLRKLALGGLSRLPQAISNPSGAVDKAIADSPLAPVRSFWDSLREMEDWWPLLLPTLLWVFWRPSQRERAALVAEREQA